MLTDRDVLWDPQFTQRSPMFEPLVAVAAELQSSSWPSRLELQRAADARHVVTRSGKPLRFLAPQLAAERFEDKYEPSIYLRGEMQMRSENWHDLLNALVWMTFSRAKAALNARHFAELERRRAERALNRGRVEDALTLFDEGGVIVASSDARLSRLLGEFRWKELFWNAREQVNAGLRCYVFGHALYEKALAPFTGITGRGIVFDVTPEFFALRLDAQINALDVRLAHYLVDPCTLRAPRELQPVPVLGVPGWFAHNAHESYYDDIGYFRPGRAR